MTKARPVTGSLHIKITSSTRISSKNSNCKVTFKNDLWQLEDFQYSSISHCLLVRWLVCIKVSKHSSLLQALPKEVLVIFHFSLTLLTIHSCVSAVTSFYFSKPQSCLPSPFYWQYDYSVLPYSVIFYHFVCSKICLGRRSYLITTALFYLFF